MTAQVHHPTGQLGYVTEVRPSGVNKKSVDAESPVVLCNYTDIYYNNRITSDMDFMEATASASEIDRLSLQHGDIVVTKDSETADDIGIPALVSEPLNGVVLGYHNALIRVDRSKVEPRFAFWTMASEYAAGYWEIKARGVTRVGLRTEDMASFPMPLPTLEVQRRVADMLDAETARIDTLINKNKQVIQTLRDRSVVLRRDLITGGAPLGSDEARTEVNARGWRLAPLWLTTINHDNRRVPLNATERKDRKGPYPYWGANSIQGYLDDWIFEGEHVLIGEDGAPYFDAKRDVAWVASGRYWVNNHAHVLEPIGISPSWLAECLNTVDYSFFITGSTRDKLTQDALNRIPIPIPPPKDEAAIMARLTKNRARSDRLTSLIQRQIELLEQRRRSLITAAVTGQISV